MRAAEARIAELAEAPPEREPARVFELPATGPVVLVAAIGEAEGARPAAAALACAAAGGEAAPLLVDVAGRPPRQTLIATAAAQRLEERLAAHLPRARLAARGQFCQLAVPLDADGLEAASAAATVARGGAIVVHADQAGLPELLRRDDGLRPSAVLLRAAPRRDRALLALVVREPRERGLEVAVLKRRLSWVAERRALFGALPPEQAVLPPRALRLLQTKDCYDGAKENGHDRPERQATRGGTDERRQWSS